jgi:SAM-dependent methyltransferase
MKSQRDAYGSELMAVYQGKKNTFEIVERDDHLIGVSNWPERYFSDYDAWSRREKRAMRLIRGRVLDIGCGAGRHGLYLQRKGFDVTGIDNSPGAIRVCKLRGYRNVRLLPVTGIYKFRQSCFDTVIMFGNNFGLFGGFKKAKRLLKQLYRITSPNGQILAESLDPYRTRDRLHLAYHRFNRERGRMGGQLRIRVRHGTIVGQWFDYLLVSQAEMKRILSGTGWNIAQILADKGPFYIAVIEKTGNQRVGT